MHALLGENGAGKSTLMNVLYGLYRPDEGEILLNGEPVVLKSAKDAIDRGIGMVHQHFMLIPVMTVAENIVLANEPTHAGILLDEDAAAARVRELARTFKFEIDPNALIADITVGQQQRVEILKALYRSADILILDEPTAVLTPQEALELFEILRILRTEGMSIIFITHKLNEVLEIADRISVLRRGKKIDTVAREGATEAGLAQLMVGREVVFRVEKHAAEARGAAAPGRGPARLRRPRHREGARRLVRGPRRRDRRDRRCRQQRAERADRRAHRPAPRRLGDDHDGRDASSRQATPKEMVDEAGLGHIPEDRHLRGLILDFSLAENLALHDYRHEPDSKLGWLFPKHLVEPRTAPAPGVRRPRRRPARRRRARSRAATSRRSCWPARSTATRRC